MLDGPISVRSRSSGDRMDGLAAPSVDVEGVRLESQTLRTWFVDFGSRVRIPLLFSPAAARWARSCATMIGPGSSLGAPETWPQPLRTAVRFMLNTGHPMYIWWGAEGACLYNDAYRASIGPERHPSSLGRPVREVWAEIWDIIGPQIEQVMAGGPATWHENQLVPITRHGKREDVYWTYSYGPIDDPDAANGIGGVLVVCTETTATVLAERERAAQADRQRRLFEQAPSFMAILEGPEHRITFANAAYMRLVGDREVIGRRVSDALPEAAAQGYLELLDRVFQSGVAYSATSAKFIVEAAFGEAANERYLDFVYQPITDAEGHVTGVFVEGHDVTERTLTESALRASEARLHELNANLEWHVAKRAADLQASEARLRIFSKRATSCRVLLTWRGRCLTPTQPLWRSSGGRSRTW